ncbi:MAG: class I SAM-dependent methyltransferase [Rhodoferax sp.]
MADAFEKQTTADYWSENTAGSNPFSPEVYWLAIPRVQSRFQRQAVAGLNYESWAHYCVGELLGARAPVARALSIGCGSGVFERELHRLQAFQQCDALDIAPGAIDLAVRDARATGIGNIHFRVQDVEHSVLPRGHYDAVWFNGSLHHIGALEAVCEQVRHTLKPDGWLFFNEYVGANHFGFDATQRAAIEHAFGLIPPRFRRAFSPGNRGQVQHAVPLPDPLEVARVDPSEAVRSADILNVVRQHFDVVVENRCGGSLLQFVLHGIAGNFREDDPDSMQILEMLFAVEDALIATGSLKSDFVAVAARPKSGG